MPWVNTPFYRPLRLGHNYSVNLSRESSAKTDRFTTSRETQNMQPRHSTNTTNVLEGSTDTTTAPQSRRQSGRASAAKPQSTSSQSQPQSREKQTNAEKRTVDLTFQQPNARSVCVAGSFNNWDQNKTPMRREGADSVWRVALPLKPGRYEYRFVVDGQWISDPNAKESATNDFGSTNSVLVV